MCEVDAVGSNAAAQKRFGGSDLYFEPIIDAREVGGQRDAVVTAAVSACWIAM